MAHAAREMHRYPDFTGEAVREALALHLGASPDNILLGCGSGHLLQQAFLAYVEPGDEVCYAWPNGFGAHPLYTQLLDGEPAVAPLAGQTTDLDGLLARVTPRTKLVCLTNPNNPTSTAFGNAALTEFLDQIPKSCLVMLDEAYFEYMTLHDAANGVAEALRRPNVIALRTFSKAFGLASLRLGYAVADVEVLRNLKRTGFPLTTNGLAQAAAVASLESLAGASRTRPGRGGRSQPVHAELKRRGWPVALSQTNFLWLPMTASKDVATQLELTGVITRSFDGGLRRDRGHAGGERGLPREPRQGGAGAVGSWRTARHNHRWKDRWRVESAHQWIGGLVTNDRRKEPQRTRGRPVEPARFSEKVAGAGAALLGTGAGLAACGSSPTTTATTKAAGKPKQGRRVAGGRYGRREHGHPQSVPDRYRPGHRPVLCSVRAAFLHERRRSPRLQTGQGVHGKCRRNDVDLASPSRYRVHDGKSLTADDVIYSLKYMADPKTSSIGAAQVTLVDIPALKKLDPLTVQIRMKSPLSILPDFLAGNIFYIVPEGWTPKSPPNGTGPFKYKSFTPGIESVFVANDNYWGGRPYVDEYVITDYSEETSQVNALLGGNVDLVNYLSTDVMAEVESSSLGAVVISKTGSWYPFTMRVDQAPFNDVRVRQAMRLIVDRKEMNTVCQKGMGMIGNDVFSPYDPVYDHSIPRPRAGHRQGQVAFEGGRSRGADRQARDVQHRTDDGPAGHRVRTASLGRRRDGQPGQRHECRLLRKQLSDLDIRPGRLEHARLPATGEPGDDSWAGGRKRDPLQRSSLHLAV